MFGEKSLNKIVVMIKNAIQPLLFIEITVYFKMMESVYEVCFVNVVLKYKGRL